MIKIFKNDKNKYKLTKNFIIYIYIDISNFYIKRNEKYINKYKNRYINIYKLIKNIKK